MGEVVNFNKFRKQKAREAAREQAEVNRMLHGQSKADKELNKTTNDKTVRELDGKKRETEEDSPRQD